jgi:Ser/Thr protein kinase RdoA (MazF antagonist)
MTALGELEADHVVMPDAEAVALANRLWGLGVARAERLATEQDDTFRLDDAFILKVSNPAQRAEEIDFECRAMVHAGERGVPTPRLLGGPTAVRDEAGQARVARVMELVAGTPLDSTGSTARERERVGEVLAALRLALADFTHPAQGRRCAWDIAHLPSLAPLLDAVPDRGGLLRAGFERYLRDVAPHVGGLRRQVLHNDFSKSNLIVDHDSPEFVRGVIDFGDTVHTAIAIDVSTALLNQLPREPMDDLLADGRDVLRGYERVADLLPVERELLPGLVLGRVIARTLITLYRAEQMPHNAAYILRNTEPGWTQLAWFLER